MSAINTTDLRRTALRLRYHDIGMSDEVNCAAAEIDALRARLEIDDKTGYDGIECRDMTISGQDKLIDGLRADNALLRDLLRGAIVDDLLPYLPKEYVASVRAALQGESK